MKNNQGAVVIYTFVGALASMAFLIAFNGWAISLLWGWFAAPILGLRAISIAEGVGLAVFLSYLRGRQKSDVDAEDLINGLATKLVVLLMGYGIHTYFIA